MWLSLWSEQFGVSKRISEQLYKQQAYKVGAGARDGG